MATSFWLQLKKPILTLAPMEGSSRMAAGQAYELLHVRPARRVAPCFEGTGATPAPDTLFYLNHD